MKISESFGIGFVNIINKVTAQPNLLDCSGIRHNFKHIGIARSTPSCPTICAHTVVIGRIPEGANGTMIGDQWQIGLRDDMAEQILNKLYTNQERNH